MRWPIPAMTLVLGLACTPPQAVFSTALGLPAVLVPPRIDVSRMPALSPEERAAQMRLLPLPVEAVFPKVLDVLLDQGFQILHANRELGLVSVRRQWMEQQGMHHPLLTVEATLVFTPEGPGTTRVRAMMAGRINVVSDGERPVSRTVAQRNVEARDYAELLDRVAQGLLPRPKA